MGLNRKQELRAMRIITRILEKMSPRQRWECRRFIKDYSRLLKVRRAVA